MKPYRDLWVGALVVIVLVAALATLLSSRARLLLAGTKPAPERRVTWVEVPASTVSPAPVVTTPVTPSAAPRFTLDFGTFVAVKDVEDAERHLKAAGVDTVRYHDTATVSVYVLKVGQFSSAEEAAEGLRALNARYPSVPLGRVEREAEQRVTIVAEASHVLRDAVVLAERLRRDGIPVRLQTSGTDRGIVGLRLKGDYDAGTTRSKERELARRGFPSSVVRATPEPSS